MDNGIALFGPSTKVVVMQWDGGALCIDFGDKIVTLSNGGWCVHKEVSLFELAEIIHKVYYEQT